MEQKKLISNAHPTRIKKSIPDTEWAASAIKKQGDLILSIMRKAMEEDKISRISVEAIDRALAKAGHDMQLHHIKVAIKNLINRELIARDAKVYRVIKRERYI